MAIVVIRIENCCGPVLQVEQLHMQGYDEFQIMGWLELGERALGR
jgi:hypothetical protein